MLHELWGLELDTAAVRRSIELSATLISEVWFGWATAEDLQPNIDGLSFDEVLLGLVPGVLGVLGIRFWARAGRSRQAT